MNLSAVSLMCMSSQKTQAGRGKVFPSLQKERKNFKLLIVLLGTLRSGDVYRIGHSFSP